MSWSRAASVRAAALAAGLALTGGARLLAESPSSFSPCDVLERESTCWNRRARELVGRHRVDPPRASRVYAILSIAQHEAMIAARGGGSGELGLRGLREGAAVDAASQVVLSELFALTAIPPPLTRADRRAGAEVGHRVAGEVLGLFATDGSQAEHGVSPPLGPQRWRSQVGRPPLRPSWGNVRPLAVQSADEYLPPPPPDPQSQDFLTALEQVRQTATDPSEVQRRSAAFWDDSIGTPTPTGHWNAIAAQLVARATLDEEEATRVVAVLNVAMMDAGIVCWRAKYLYWTMRPNQADPAIRPLLKVPNFPAYPSGHAAFSGAAAAVLAHFFPAHAMELRATAEAAALSRVFGGIHYPYDAEAGLVVGQRVARVVIGRSVEQVPLLRDLAARSSTTQAQSPAR